LQALHDADGMIMITITLNNAYFTFSIVTAVAIVSSTAIERETNSSKLTRVTEGIAAKTAKSVLGGQRLICTGLALPIMGI